MGITVVPIIKVRDIKKSEEFYCAILSFKKQTEYAASSLGPWYVSIS